MPPLYCIRLQYAVSLWDAYSVRVSRELKVKQVRQAPDQICGCIRTPIDGGYLWVHMPTGVIFSTEHSARNAGDALHWATVYGISLSPCQGYISQLSTPHDMGKTTAHRCRDTTHGGDRWQSRNCRCYAWRVCNRVQLPPRGVVRPLRQCWLPQKTMRYGFSHSNWGMNAPGCRKAMLIAE